MKIFPAVLKAKFETEIKMMLHASRDCMRNQFESGQSKYDPAIIRFVISDGYYGEAFGLVRATVLLGYMKYGPINVAGTAQNWFSNLEQEVLWEENFYGNHECDFCLKAYGKDGAGRRSR